MTEAFNKTIKAALTTAFIRIAFNKHLRILKIYFTIFCVAIALPSASKTVIL